MEETALNIVMLGKTGNGKTSSANTILGREAFEVSTSTLVGTRLASSHSSRYRDVNIIVFDSPGIFDARFELLQGQKKSCQQIMDIVEASEKVDVFMLVLSYTCRWSYEDNVTVELIRKILGRNVFETYCVIVITHWDNALSAGVESVRTWLSIQPKQLRDLVVECQNRCVVLDNNTRDAAERGREELLDLAFTMAERNNKYTLEDLNRNSHEHTKLLENKVQHQHGRRPFCPIL